MEQFDCCRVDNNEKRLYIEATHIETIILLLQCGLCQENVSFFKPSCHTRFQRAFLNAFAFPKRLPWFAPTEVISLKTQQHAINAR